MLDIAGHLDLAKLLEGDSSLALKLALTLDQHSIISITDIAGRITFVNNKFCQISGYNAKELLGQNHRILKSDYHNDEFYKDMWNTISSGNTWQGVVCNKRKDGSLYWVESTILPMLDEQGKPYQYISARTDITDSAQTTDRYSRSQQFARIGTWDWNIGSGELYWSDQIAPLFGYSDTVPETSYDNFIAAVHPADRQMVMDAVNDCVENGAEYNIEHRVVWQDGSTHWLHETGDVVRSKDGKPLHMLGVVRDITKRKTAQLNLQESEKRLTQAQAIASLGSWAWDIASGRLFWSDEIYRIFGHTPDAFKPTYDSFIASIHPDDLEQVLESEKNALSHGTKHSIDHRIIRPNGSIRWVHEEAEAILNESGQAMTLQGTVQDITDRKYAEQLEKGRSRILEEVVNDKPLNEILTTMILHAEEIQPDMIGSVLMLDDSGQHLLHASAPNLPDFYTQAIDGATIGPDVGSCGAAAFSKKPVIIENIEAHPNWQNCIDLTQKANLKACWSHPILSSSGNILGTFAMYYSEPRAPTEYELNLAAELAKFAAIAIEHTRAQENLIKAREEAIKANLAKSEFLSSMSHELRTPLNAIIGFSQLLKMPDNNFDEHQTKGVEEIHHAGKHLLELINDILDLARIEAGKINLSIENLLIGEVLAECLNLISPLATRHKLDILLTFNNRELGFMEISDLDLQVRADKTRLKQVLINLMSNAAKYNKDNGKISITGELIEDKNLRIAITDTGKGISEEQQKKLFKPFSRLGAEFSNIEGTGIGLVITKNIIESMGGQIGFNSTPGEGSTFWIDIPLATHSVAETNNRFDNNMNTTTNDSDTQYTVLYIEDNPSNVRLVAQLLKHRPNIKLLEAVEPISGIELALNEKPDLILLDINLPTMNGFDVLKELKKHDPTASTPVLAVSANAMAEDIENGEIAGFDEYITKPIDTVAFLKTMDKYLK